MPELPEVETVRRSLAPAVGAQIGAVRYSGLPLRQRTLDLGALSAAARRARIEGARRLGKYLLVDLRGRDHSILIHLGMSGRLRLTPATVPPFAHTHVVWTLGDGREMRFSDPRRFGQVDLVVRGREREHPALAKLGLDPLVDVLTADILYDLTRASRQPIKSFLFDQRRVAGIGNIYASEALWRARIRPSAPTNKLSRARVERLAEAIPYVFHRALDHGGTSLRDFIAADGTAGENAAYLEVYGRTAEPCHRPGCGGKIRRISTQGRATFYCPTCQPR